MKKKEKQKSWQDKAGDVFFSAFYEAANIIPDEYKTKYMAVVYCLDNPHRPELFVYLENDVLEIATGILSRGYIIVHDVGRVKVARIRGKTTTDNQLEEG